MRPFKSKVNKTIRLSCKAFVSNISAINQLVIQVQNEFNKVEILFVNAGIFIPIPVGQIGKSAYNHQMDINLKGAIFTTEKFL